MTENSKSGGPQAGGQKSGGNTSGGPTKRLVDNDRFAAYTGVKLISAQPGHAVTRLTVEDKHLNGVDFVQGGAIFTLADYAFAAASNAEGFPTVSIAASISYVKTPRGKHITAEAKQVSATNRLCSYLVNVYDESGELAAQMTATGYIKR
jgi:acyl-CoA thioesterase